MKITVSCEKLNLDSIDALIERLQAIRAESPTAVLRRDHNGLYAFVYRDATPEETAGYAARWAKIKRELEREAAAYLDTGFSPARLKEQGAQIDIEA